MVLTSPPDPTGGGHPPVRAAHQRSGPYSSVAIGSFDGVHLGHRQVLVGCDTVLTFDPHPRRVLAPSRAPCLLSDQPTKLRKLAALGIRRTAIIRFDAAWSRLAAEDFVEHVLLGRLGAKIVSVGANFRFGAGGTSTAATLARYPSLQTRVIPLVTGGPGGQPISSTRIRQLVAGGDVEGAAALLAGPLVLPAVVVGHHRLVIDGKYALPATGRYHGSVGGRPGTVEVAGNVVTTDVDAGAPGTTVAVAFLQLQDKGPGAAQSSRCSTNV